MRILILFLFSFSVIPLLGQSTTYSAEEEKMIHYINNSLAYAEKYNTPKNIKPIIDSCYKFLAKYPNSFAKPSVFTYLLEMTARVNKDIDVLTPLIDSVLYYDKLPGTKQRIGATLIERNLDIKRGREYLIDALPELSNPYHVFNTFILLAKSDIALGNLAAANINFISAFKIDSSRAGAWYEYLAFLKMNELTEEAEPVQSIINRLDKESRLQYINQPDISPNTNKNVSGFVMRDLDSNTIRLDSLKGRIIIINRFAFWCPYCIKEFPVLRKMMKEFPKVEFIFINSGETSEELRKIYFKKNEFSFLKKQTILFPSKEFYDEIYGDGIPHTMVIDKDGNIRYDYIGYKGELEKLLRSNLQTLFSE